MRVRRTATAATLLGLMLVVTGCSRSAPEITDEQVEQWRTLAAETIPTATVIDIRADQVTTMAGGTNIVFVTVHFATFTDLKASFQAVSDLNTTVGKLADASTSLLMVNDGSATFTSEIDARLLDGVPGLAGSRAFSYDTYSLQTGTPSLTVTANVYVADPAVIDLAWLDQVSTITQQVASDAGGSIYSIAVLPADTMDLNLSDADIEEALVPVASLKAIKDLGVDNGCVRTDAWAYDVSNPWAIVYPATAPEGACA